MSPKKYAKRLAARSSASPTPAEDPKPSSITDVLNDVPEIQDLLWLSKTPQVTIHFESYRQSRHTITIDKTLNRIINPHKDIYCIASIAKVLIAAAFIKLDSSDEYSNLETNLGNPVYTIINNDRKRRGLTPVKRLGGNPKIEHVLLHCSGVANDNQWLLGPDGTSIVSAEKALHIAPEMTAAEDQKNGVFEYSNWNYILAGLALEATFRERYAQDPNDTTDDLIFKIMRELLFKPLKMEETYIGWRCPSHLQNRVVPGHTVDSGIPVELAKKNKETAVPATVYPFGAWSTAEDIANLYRAILQGLGGEPNSFFSYKEARKLVFCESWVTKEMSNTFAGVGESLCSNTLGSELLDNDLIGHQDDRNLGLGRRANGETVLVNSKYGFIDGYSSCVYLAPFENLIVIVLANSTGPFNAVGDIAHTILQQHFSLSPVISILDRAKIRLGLVRASFSRLEEEDKASQLKICTGGDLMGNYYHEKNFQQIEVCENGDVYIRGDIGSSGPFKLAMMSEDKVRIIPGETKFGIERYSYNTVFRVERDSTRKQTRLIKGRDVFTRRIHSLVTG